MIILTPSFSSSSCFFFCIWMGMYVYQLICFPLSLSLSLVEVYLFSLSLHRVDFSLLVWLSPLLLVHWIFFSLSLAFFLSSFLSRLKRELVTSKKRENTVYSLVEKKKKTYSYNHIYIFIQAKTERERERYIHIHLCTEGHNFASLLRSIIKFFFSCLYTSYDYQIYSFFPLPSSNSFVDTYKTEKKRKREKEK